MKTTRIEAAVQSGLLALFVSLPLLDSMLGLDRQERGRGELSDIQEIERTYAVPVLSIIQMEHIIGYLESLGPDLASIRAAMENYSEQYGVNSCQGD